jgi:gliding motility-associated-like protein
MGLGNGIILSSGLAEEAENPELFFASTIMGVPGDADLDLLSAVSGGAESNDACILEFDVYAATDELEFKYVFGSEEYPNFVGSTFNDIFAFFISGPGIVPNTPVGLHNMAVLEDGTPVEINTVNFNTPFDPVTGELIYNDNAGGLSLPYGGYTSVLTARADVIPCNIYHLKLAIADRGDSSYDSGVFLADLQAGLPELQLVFDINSSSGENILVEGCSDGDYINAILTNPSDNNITYYLQVEGEIDENADLTQPIPDSLVAPPGETVIQIPFLPVNDGIDEGGVENFGIQVFAVFQCDTVVYDSVSISIYDEIDITPDQDTFFVCSGTSVQLGVSGATGYTWDWPIPSELDNPNLANPTLTPSQSGPIYISGIINANSNCTDTDSAYVQIIDPSILVTSPPPFICEGESTQLTVMTNTNNTGISWSPTTGLSCTDCPDPVVTPAATTTYTATVSAGGCSASDQVTVTVDPLGVPGIIADTEICEGESIILATAPTGSGAAITSYSWTPDDGSLNDATLPNPTATPSTTTTYTVTATSENGVCSNTQQVTISVFPATIDIQGPDTIYWCDTDMNSITLNANTIVDPNTVQWTDSGGGTWPAGPSIDVAPTTTTTYTATISIGACVNSADLTIQIDSLPNMDLNVLVPDQGIAEMNPDTVDVCADPSQSFFVSNIYDASLYPDIQHNWLMNGMDMNPPQTTANMLDNLPSATTTYYIETNNNACSAIDSFVIDVNTPPSFAITPVDTTVCVGQSVQLEAVGAPAFTWVPDDGTLSDININNPVATPTQTTTYVATATVGGCQVGVASTITVIEEPSVLVAADPIICGGTSVNIGDDANDPSLTYQWMPGNLSGSNPSVSPAVTTTYTVAVTNGSCGTTASVTVTVGNELPLTITGNTDICLGESADLYANTQGAVFWYDDAGTLLGTNPALTVSPTVNSTYTITSTDGNCTNTETVLVTVNATPDLTATGDTEICPGESATISANTDAGTISWSPANEFTDPTAATQTVSPLATTTYLATATNGGCVVQESVTVTVAPSPVYAVAPDQSVCLGTTVLLGTVANANTDYSWTASPADPTLTAPNAATPSVIPTQPTTYTLVATSGNCTETATVTVDVVDAALTVTPEATICAGDTATLVAQGTPAGGTYTWVDWEGNVIGTDNTLEVSPFSSTSYAVNYALGGCSITEISEVNVIDYFNVLIEADPDVFIPTGTDVTLTAVLTGSMPAGATFTWTDAQGNVIGMGESITVNPDSETTYKVTVTTPDGCSAAASITIYPRFAEPRFANVFTPSGDELNDDFYPIVDLNVQVVEFKVFGRWGGVIHDNPAEGWDGTFDGKPMPSDVYVYFARIVNADGEESFHKGDVTLLR